MFAQSESNIMIDYLCKHVLHAIQNLGMINYDCTISTIMFVIHICVNLFDMIAQEWLTILIDGLCNRISIKAKNDELILKIY